jgi:hypothetical protein
MQIFCARHYKEWRINNNPSHIFSKYFKVVMIIKITLFIVELLPIIYLKAFSVTMLELVTQLSLGTGMMKKKLFSFFSSSSRPLE